MMPVCHVDAKRHSLLWLLLFQLLFPLAYNIHASSDWDADCNSKAILPPLAQVDNAVLSNIKDTILLRHGKEQR